MLWIGAPVPDPVVYSDRHHGQVDSLLRQDPQTTQTLVATLAQVPRIREREQNLLHDGPQPGSVADRTRQLPSGRYPEIFASQFLVVAGDNLLTWHTVLHAKVQPGWGHLSLVRTAIECVVNARWLLDPGLTWATRVARGLAAQRADYDERKKFEGARSGQPQPEPPGKTAAQRLADLERERVANGIANESMNATKASADYLVGSGNGEGTYRLLSAFAHGKQWSLLASDKAILLGMNPPPQAHVGQVTARDDVSVGMTDIAVGTYAAAIDDLERFFHVTP